MNRRSYDLLQRIAQGPLPLRITDPAQVETLHVLRDGGWIRARFETLPPEPDAFGHEGAARVAVVTHLTSVGRIAMTYVQRDKDPGDDSD